MPLSHKIKEIMESGIIGEPRILTATLCYMMPHKETISIMKQMDGLRKEWGVKYPYDA